VWLRAAWAKNSCGFFRLPGGSCIWPGTGSSWRPQAAYPQAAAQFSTKAQCDVILTNGMVLAVVCGYEYPFDIGIFLQPNAANNPTLDFMSQHVHL